MVAGAIAGSATTLLTNPIWVVNVSGLFPVSVPIAKLTMLLCGMFHL